jgi:outer membrane lipoprotein
MRTWLLVLGALVVVGCARVPPRLAGTYPPTTVGQAQAADHVGERVRWGGEIVVARPGTQDTCLEIVGLPLDRQARPRRSDESAGRFIACAPGFYDPAVYAPRREVTVVGTLAPTEVHPVGGYDYEFPLVRAEVIHLWPERTERRAAYYPYPFDSFGWYPYYRVRAPIRRAGCR